MIFNTPETKGFRRIVGYIGLFPLDGADGLGSEVEENTVDTLNLVGYSVGDMME